jgi:hypothetical protein
MDRKSYKMLGWLVAFAALAVLTLPRIARASDDPQGVLEDEVLWSQYYDVSKADSTIHVTNNTENNLCAQFYVFDSFEQLQECCSCPISTNGFLVLSVITDLTSNPSHGRGPTRGVIELQSTLPNNGSGCAVNQGPGVPYEAQIFPMLDAWITHVQAVKAASGTAAYIIPSEQAFAESDDSEVQEDNLESQCAAAFSSGFGLCTCGSS